MSNDSEFKTKMNTYGLSHHLLPGGTQEVRAINKNDISADPREFPKVSMIGVSGSVSHGGEVSFDSGFMSFNGANLKSSLAGDILSTARTHSGSPVSDMSKLTNDTIVKVGGTECTVGTAIRCGLLARDGQGNVIDPTARGQIASDPQASAQAPTPVKVDLAGGSRPVLTDIYRKMGSGTADATITSLINSALNEDGNKADRTLEHAGKALGTNASEARKIFQGVLSDLDRNARAFGERKLGIPMDKVLGHMKQCSKMYQTSCYIRMLNNDLTVFKELAENYKLGNKF